LAWHQASENALKYNNRLVVHAVDDNTNRVYQKAVKEFLVDVKRHDIDFTSVKARDHALADYISDLCYVREASFGQANMLFNGFMHIFEDHRDRLPTSARALKSWLRFGQQGEGEPVPMESVGLIIYYLFQAGLLIEGAAVLTQLDGWLREQDWQQLRGDDVAEGPGGQMALTLGRRDRGEKVKTGANQGVILSWPVTAAVVRVLAKSCGKQDLVFPITQDKYRKEWRSAASSLKLKVGPPHAIRHTGAACYVAAGGCLETARRKGRWQTTSALQRYTKTHVLVNALSQLSAEQIRRGLDFWANPAELIAEAIGGSPRASSELAKSLIAELKHVHTGVSVPVFDGGGRVLTTGRASTEGRSRHRRQQT